MYRGNDSEGVSREYSTTYNPQGLRCSTVRFFPPFPGKQDAHYGAGEGNGADETVIVFNHFGGGRAGAIPTKGMGTDAVNQELTLLARFRLMF